MLHFNGYNDTTFKEADIPEDRPRSAEVMYDVNYMNKKKKKKKKKNVQYIPGVNKTGANCMSQFPLQSLEEDDDTDDDVSQRYQTLQMVPYLQTISNMLHRRTVQDGHYIHECSVAST